MNITLAKKRNNNVKPAKAKKADMKVIGTRIIVAILAFLMVGSAFLAVIPNMF